MVHTGRVADPESAESLVQFIRSNGLSALDADELAELNRRLDRILAEVGLPIEPTED